MKNKKKTLDISAEEMMEAMDIVRGMSYEEIQELLNSNTLYKNILTIDEERDGIPKETN